MADEVNTTTTVVESSETETQQTEAEKQGEIDLENIFGDQITSPESSEEKETSASGEGEEEASAKEETPTEKKEEGAEKKEEVKETSDEKSEEVTAAEKVLADQKTADELKVAYEKLTPEEKAATDAAAARDTETRTTLADLKITVEKSDKRNQDTTRWAQGLSRDVADLKRENLILKKQAEDPEYDPAKDTSLDTGPTEEQKEAAATQKGRADSSLIAAYGKDNENKEAVDRDLKEYRDTFASDPVVQQQVVRSAMPVQEAISIVRLSKFFGEYGRDPEAIIATVTERLTKELEPKIREEETKKILAGLKKTNVLPKGLSGIKESGASGTGKETGSSKPRTLEEEFD